MRRELFETGKSVDAAIDSACEKLGCSRDDCEWEIIDLPKKGFWGLKNTPAKVRVSVEIITDDRPELDEKQKDEKPKIEAKPKSVEAKPKSEPESVISAPKSAEAPRKSGESKIVKSEDMSEKEKLAIEYLSEIIDAAGLKAGFELRHEHEGSCINITGEGLGMIIGRRGDTLDALQYLTGLIANRGEGDYMRLTVDCEGYRLKRRDTLESLARKLANQVLKSNVSRTLEPMNPFERRVIHATVSEIDGVISSSIGDEPNRRVIITSPTARPAPRSNFRYDRRDGERSGGYDRGKAPRRGARQAEDNADNGKYGRHPDKNNVRRPRQAPQTVQGGPPKQTPEAEATSGISFGKVELD